LPQLAAQLAAGFAGPGAFLAHIAVPVDVQRMRADAIPLPEPAQRRPAPGITPRIADELSATFIREPFAVWVGAGARRAAPQVRELLDRTGAPVFSTPRGLGIADRHPRFLGVSGNGGSPTLTADLARWGVTRTLVLGTGLGEASTGWVPELVPHGGLVHVDLDPSVFGRAYPQAATLGLQAGVAEVLEALLARRLVRREVPPEAAAAEAQRPLAPPPAKRGVVHPVALMSALQRIVIDGSTAPVFADASTAMFLAARYLRFPEPGRFHLEPHFGAMGMAGAAVVGAASSTGGPVVALCGDGSVHMHDEIGTAVSYGLPAVWVVLNDDGLGIVRHGMRRNGNLTHDADYPPTDFAAVARAKGAQAARVTCAHSLGRVLRQALVAGGPFLIDVVVDPSVAPPLGLRAAR
jgi:acetolactate synthase-1/2/3 large subunit